jgi:Tfp pilus assembly protein FimV
MATALKLTSDQVKPSRLVDRLLRGEIDPANDDFFVIALEETKRAAEKKVQRIARLQAQMEKLQAEIKAEELSLEGLQDRYREQREAIERYQQTGEIADCIIPRCGDAERKDEAEVRRAECEGADLETPEGWERSSVRADDEFVYVTFRKRRATTGDAPPSVRSRVIDAVVLFGRLQAKQRRERAQVWNRLGRYTTMPIAANGP